LHNRKFIILISFIIILLILYIFFITNITLSKKNTFKNNQKIQATANKKEDKSQVGEKAENNKADIKEKIFAFKFEEAEQDLLKFKESNESNFSKNADLKEMLNELALMANFKEMRERNENKRIIELIKSFKNSDDFFASIMWLEDSDRKYLIESSESLNPVFYGNVKIINKREISLKDLNDLYNIKSKIENIDKCIEYKFEIENYNLLAYIIKADDNLYLYSITETEEGKTPYFTIEEWDKFYEETQKNLDKN